MTAGSTLSHGRDMSRVGVVVVGSANLDVSLAVHRLPVPGETVSVLSKHVGLGGKGANQAAAAAASGVNTSLVAAIGNDDAGRFLQNELLRYGIDLSALGIINGPSGTATIMVDDSGENIIAIDNGANDHLTAQRIEESDDRIKAAAVMVVQAEIAPSSVTRAMEIADKHHTRIVLNLAPFVSLATSFQNADPLVMNEIEAGQFLGRPLQNLADVRSAAAEAAHQCRSVVITVGADGAILADADGVVHVPGEQVQEVVDTTGAGDAFVGALAAGLAAGLPLRDSAKRAVHAAAKSVQHRGAATSYFSFAD